MTGSSTSGLLLVVGTMLILVLATGAAGDRRGKYTVGQCLRHLDMPPVPYVWGRVLEVREGQYLVDLSPYKRRSKFSTITAYLRDFDIEGRTYVVPCPGEDRRLVG